MTHTSQSQTTSKQPPGLYLVATPIGNLEDITLRAINILKSADCIACEDTRVTKILLSRYDIQPKKLTRYHDFSDDHQKETLIELVRSGKIVAIVSDAGTPLVSDPGYKLVQRAIEAEVDVFSIPGACAAITALSVSGLPSDRFYFEGFLPPKKQARQKRLAELKNIPSTLIFYESARRLIASLGDIEEVLLNPNVAICRELTKKFEQVIRKPASEVLEMRDDLILKGEIVLIVENSNTHKKHYSDQEVEQLLAQALQSMSTKEAANFVSEITSKNKKQLYPIALSLKEKQHGQPQ
jgi:16S rRNA (cytidine1402-2'-O)-methyltransferase